MTDKTSLSEYLALNEAEIRGAFFKGADIKILVPLQQIITLADEDGLVDFISFMMKLCYASQSAKQDGRLENINVIAYGALVNTAIARLRLLVNHREQQHKNLAIALDSLVI